MKMLEILRLLNLGASVAEFDDALEKYFVETEAFRALAEGRMDVVAGDKGTGKTALFKILSKRHRQIPQLKDTEVFTAFNPTGNPVFQRLLHEQPLTEGQYRSVWKAYFLSLLGNWVLNIVGEEGSPAFTQLNEILKTTDLRLKDDSPNTVFSKIANLISGLSNPSAGQLTWTFSETGIPIITARVELEGGKPKPELISHEDALRLLNTCLKEMGISVWIVLDRLDEAFQGSPAIEVPALRALFRTYLDLLEFDCMRMKLFVRRDLFSRIISGGFVNLTHINARKIEIIWNEDDLLHLLCQRMKESGSFLEQIGASKKSNKDIFSSVFPAQINIGEKKPATWDWVMSRIRDGNNVKPPRNLIDLVTKARETQIRREERESREYTPDVSIIDADAMRNALTRLSETRVEDTLLAEAGDAVGLIKKFKYQKSEHNRQSLSVLLGLKDEPLETAISRLKEIGFLEEVGGNFKIPMLYRDGMSVVQGKAF